MPKPTVLFGSLSFAPLLHAPCRKERFPAAVPWQVVSPAPSAVSRSRHSVAEPGEAGTGFGLPSRRLASPATNVPLIEMPMVEPLSVLPVVSILNLSEVKVVQLSLPLVWKFEPL